MKRDYSVEVVKKYRGTYGKFIKNEYIYNIYFINYFKI